MTGARKSRTPGAEGTRAPVVLITGVMAAGKSTVAQLLAERLPKAAHVRGDFFRRMMVSGREELMPEETPEALAQLWLRYRLSAATADAYAAQGWTAVVQDVILGKDLADYAALIRTEPLHIVVLSPEPDVVAAREEGRAKTGYGAWTIEALDASLREDTPRLGLWIDNSRQTPEETVQTVLDHIDGLEGFAADR
ncbi:AAA family ATPase [Streptomyces sp. NPDC059499]|uniref:AAA family ATPase n=1 Tax=Streptomyces sp. NPDC059499 TaxID=3346852 RepID=UPI003686962F